MITIVNYGMGNLGSLMNMLKYIGVKASIHSEPDKISEAKKLILPGVGAFDSAMENINSIPGFKDTLNCRVVKEKIPILGICLGMQLLTDGSEEGKLSGLGWIPGTAKRFPNYKKLKVPHMGWNTSRLASSSDLTKGINDNESRYYFVHSFYVQVENQKHSLMRSHYGTDFDSAIGHENVFGVQFHPEKSHKYGMKILTNFAKL